MQLLDRDAIFNINYIKRIFHDIFNKLENDDSLTISEVWKKYTILNCVRNVVLAFNFKCLLESNMAKSNCIK